ncbi:MAG: insulinase family protein [Robiginitomaculum sp.]|nr:insulinase family protein [Robiginitomaculum sp.]
MNIKPALLAIAGFTLLASSSLAQMPDIDVAYDSFTLDNGLRVVVHEDRKAPIVTVSVWYHVGSKNEPAGKTGFAHLFEHLMFNGSENYPGEYFAPFEEVGATDMNGTTWLDRTNYFETVPTPALDMALWMESDRMGHLLGVVDQEVLDEQRGVVKNEKRQGDNNPYGLAQYRLISGVWPSGHPYAHSTIGSMADLDAASLDDVKDWFKQYYGASNTVIVLAGDIDAATARTKITKYFGDIASGPNLHQMKSWVPTKTENIIEEMTDAVPQGRVYRRWAIPGRTTKDEAMLDLAAQVLGGGKNSRFYKELVYKREIATQVVVRVERHELASIFSVEVTAKPGGDLVEISKAIDDIMAMFYAKGPNRSELKRVKTRTNAAMVRGIEQIGGWTGKATRLAESALYANDPGFFKTRLEWMNKADSRSLQYAVRQWLSHGYYQLTVKPKGELTTIASSVDRSTGIPQVTGLPDLVFPKIEQATLDNGLRVVLATRSSVPVVEVALQFDAGYGADQGAKLGLSSFAMSMLDEGAGKMNALEIAEALEMQGATLNTNSGLDTSTIRLSALKANLSPSLDIMADVLLRPQFKASEIERHKKLWTARIAREKSQPVQIALRLLPPILYGKDHAYGVPFTGTGTISSINSIVQDDLSNFHRTWLRPDNGTLFVVGDTTMNEILPLLNKAFAGWKNPETTKPVKNIAQVELIETGKVILIEKKDAPQTLILAGELIPSTANENYLALETLNNVLGGQFTARVNMNLREDKSWSYGAYTFTQNAKGQRPFMVYAPVQTDRTGDSLLELIKELTDIKNDRPATADEIEKVVKNNTNALPGQFETANAVLTSLMSSDNYGRPFDYPTGLKLRYANINEQTVNAQSGQIRPEGLIWVLVGDLAKIRPQVEAAGLGPIEIWDADGNKLE